MYHNSIRSTFCVCTLLCYSASGADPGDYQVYDIAPDWDVTIPRGETVEIDFSVSEATHSSVDISPDGRWVVFDVLGHIYRVPAAGGEAQVLTQNSGIAINFHPRYSPDGARIAFVSDRAGQNNLWVMDADGGNPTPVFLDPLTRLSSPQWSPDGNAIFAVRHFPTYSMHRRSSRIWRFPVGKPHEHPQELVGRPHGTQALWPNPAGDGNHLYYMHATFASASKGRQEIQHIRRLDLSTGVSKPVTRGEAPSASKRPAPTELAPEVSPDGRWLAFARRIPDTVLTYRGHVMRQRTALWLLDLDSGEEQILMDPISRDLQDVHAMKTQKILPGYAWAKDSKSIVISAGGKIRRVWVDSGDVETIPFVARVQRTASEQIRASDKLLRGSWPSRVVRWPSVTPDERTAVFESAGWIWRKALPDGEPEKLVPDASAGFQFMPALSPDGATVAYVTWDDYALGHVWRVPVSGGRPRRVSAEASAFAYPFWSPDGRDVYALSGSSVSPAAFQEGRVTEYRLLRWRGRGSVVVGADMPLVPLAFGPGQRLYRLERHSVGHSETQRRLSLGMTLPPEYGELVSLPLSGTAEPTAHLRFPFANAAAPFPSANAAVPSADGKWVAYIEHGELYLTPFQRSQARYDRDEPMTWYGQEPPYEVIKGDPRQKVLQVSDGGAMHVRWLDERRLVYAQGNRIMRYDVQDRSTTKIDSGVTLGTPGHEKTLALTNARIVTLKDRQVIESGDLLIKGDEITCVGVCDSNMADRTIDLSGKTVIPGFIDVHAHGFGNGPPLTGEHHSPAMMYLAFGVTTLLDPAVSNEYAFGLAELINSGRIPGPRVYATGQITMPRSPHTGPVDYRQADAEVRRNAAMGAISTKIYLSPRRDQRQMFVEASRKLGMSATNEAADLLSNVASLLDGSTGLEHAMNLMPAFEDVALFMGQTRGVYSPTITVSTASPTVEEYFRSRGNLWQQPKQRRFLTWPLLSRSIDRRVEPLENFDFPVYAESIKDIVRAGGFVAIGGHGNHWGQDSHWEIWAYAAALDPLEALRVASQGGAQMLGFETELGSIEAGKLADLIVLDANPLDDIRNTALMHAVMRGGILYDDETLDQIWPEPLERPAPPWVNDTVYRGEARDVRHWDER